MGQAGTGRPQLITRRPTVTIGLLGAGAAFWQLYRHPIEKLTASRSVRLAWVFDTERPRSAAVERLFAECQSLSGLDQVERALDSTDAVIVATPARTRPELAEVIGHRPIAVLWEKPLAATATDALLIKDRCDTKRHYVGMLRRQFEPVRSFLASVDLSEANDVLVRSVEGERFHWPIMSAKPFQKPSATGVLTDVGVHHVDFIQLIWPNVVVESLCSDETDLLVDRNADLRLRMGWSQSEVRLSNTDPMWNGTAIKTADTCYWIPPGPNGPSLARTLKGRWKALSSRPFRGRAQANTYFGAVHAQLNAAFFNPGEAQRLCTVDEAVRTLALLDEARAARQRQRNLK